MKERANNKECLLDLHKRLREIEKKFNTKLTDIVSTFTLNNSVL